MAIVRLRTGTLSLIRPASRIAKMDHTMGKVNRMLWDIVRLVGLWLISAANTHQPFENREGFMTKHIPLEAREQRTAPLGHHPGRQETRRPVTSTNLSTSIPPKRNVSFWVYSIHAMDTVEGVWTHGCAWLLASTQEIAEDLALDMAFEVYPVADGYVDQDAVVKRIDGQFLLDALREGIR
jgi:hypothetical protein